MSPFLTLDADLTLTLDGDTIRVQGRGNRLTVQAPRLSAALHVSRVLQQKRGDLLPVLTALLHKADLGIDVEVAGRTVARVGAQARPGVLSRILGYSGIELFPLAIVRTWLTGR